MNVSNLVKQKLRAWSRPRHFVAQRHKFAEIQIGVALYQ